MKTHVNPGEDIYIIRQKDIDQIDTLLSVLSLALTELLEKHPLYSKAQTTKTAQRKYDQLIADVIYPNNPEKK